MRTLSYLSIRPGQPPECENLVLMCMDFRFHTELASTLTRSGYPVFDLVALPGASKSLVDEASRDVVLSAVELAINLHKVKRLIIVDHVDCLTFGGSELFATPEEEARKHTESLLKARDIVLAQFSSLEVVLVYADWSRMGVIE